MGIVAKIVNGNRHAKSRLHDEKGNFVGWSKAVIHGLPAVITGFLRIAFDYRPNTPWIAYSATRYFETFLTKNSRVLEFGSGMSTIWYAKHAGSVFAVENYRPWYDKILNKIETIAETDITYDFIQDEIEYATYMEGDSEGFDLIVVDGDVRDKCIASAVKSVRAGGVIYLDNADRTGATGHTDMVEAEATLRAFAIAVGAQIIEITDFAPTQFFVNQGLLVRLPATLAPILKEGTENVD